MAKEVVKKIKLQIPAGKATPAPPVGTVLGPAGINLQEFCTKFNDETRDKMGDIVPVEISLYDDRSYDFVLKTAPAAFLIKKADGIQTSIHYPAIQNFTAYQGVVNSTPLAEFVTEHELTLPLYPTMTIEEVDLVCDALLKGIK